MIGIDNCTTNQVGLLVFFNLIVYRVDGKMIKKFVNEEYC